MNFTLKLSLEHITLVRIAASFWAQTNIRALIVESGILLNPYEKSENWQDIEDKVLENVQRLPQPEILKQKILGFIKPIGVEILKWIKYHPRNFYNIALPSDFHWTPQGTIDKQKTAETLIREEKLDVNIRYNLACVYCLEGHILELRNKLSEDCRNDMICTTEGSMNVMQQDLVSLWTNDLYQGEAVRYKLTDCCFQNNKLDVDCFQHSPASSLRACGFAVTYRNKAALEYFLPKLTEGKRQVALLNYALEIAKRRMLYGDIKNTGREILDVLLHDIKNTDPYDVYTTEVLCFLLSHMIEEQQTHIFKNYAYRIFECFLDWPFQNCFIENVRLLSEFVSADCYIHLSEQIIDKVTCGYKDCDYLNLYSEFRNQIPVANKKCLLLYGKSALLEKLFHIKDVQFIKLLFHDVIDITKRIFILSRTGENICKNLIYDGEWDLLKFFITECISSKRDMQNLIERLEERITKDEFKKMKDKWDKFFHLSNDLLSEFQ